VLEASERRLQSTRPFASKEGCGHGRSGKRHIGNVSCQVLAAAADVTLQSLPGTASSEDLYTFAV
jgi:hypothetical protein